MKVTNWIKLIRPVNLIILAITQYFIDIFILQPNFKRYGLLFTFDEFHFFLLVLSTVLICGAGYIINDYFDIKADLVNKPEKQIVGKRISANTAFNAYMLLTGSGLAIGIYLSLLAGNWQLVTIHVIAIFLLYTYSASFQNIAVLGNLIVALLTAISIIMIGAFEPHLYQLARPGDYYAADLCWEFIFGISIFAFLLTWVREIIKDLEDLNGDQRTGAHTMPIAWGTGLSKAIAMILILCIAGLSWYFYSYWNTDHKQIYLIYSCVLSLSLLLTGINLMLATEKKQFARLSLYVKLCMLLGLCFMPVYFYTEF